MTEQSQSRKPGLLEGLRRVRGLKHYRIRTEEAYTQLAHPATSVVPSASSLGAALHCFSTGGIRAALRAFYAGHLSTGKTWKPWEEIKARSGEMLPVVLTRESGAVVRQRWSLDPAADRGASPPASQSYFPRRPAGVIRPGVFNPA
jgi:hypothetical protein